MTRGVITSSILWRRLDAPGHDACRLEERADGWRIEGAAVFRHDTVPASLFYDIECDGEWRTRQGAVRGWIGSRDVDLRVVRTAGGVWTLNGRAVPGLEGCVDLDLGFTPATNLLPLRRLALPVGAAADAPAAWLDAAAGTLGLLQQRYERRTAAEYRYEAPRFDFTTTLRVNPVGFVVSYPGLWQAEG